jgi:hypothetical protein
MINKIICFIIGHNFSIDAGFCPYTGKTYKACARCMSTEAI